MSVRRSFNVTNAWTSMRDLQRTSVTLVTLNTTFTTNGATGAEPRKVLLKSDCNERQMCYYRDRSGKLKTSHGTVLLFIAPGMISKGRPAAIKLSVIEFF